MDFSPIGTAPYFYKYFIIANEFDNIIKKYYNNIMGKVFDNRQGRDMWLRLIELKIAVKIFC